MSDKGGGANNDGPDGKRPSRAEVNSQIREQLELNIAKYLSTLDPKVLNEKEHLKVTKVEHLGAGTRHFNYFVVINEKPYNVRFSLTPHPEDHVEYEFVGLKSIEHLNVAPKAHYHESSKVHLGLPFIVIEYVEGKHPAHFTPDVLRDTAKMVAVLHNTDSDSEKFSKIRRKITKEQIMFIINDKVEYISKKMKEYGVDQKFMDGIMRAYKRLEEMEVKGGAKGVISHGDITLSNMIEGKNGLRLIDWETMAITDPAYDIATFFDLARLSDEQKKVFLQEYLAHRKDATLPERLEKFEQMRVFDRMCWCIWEVFDLLEKEKHNFMPEWRSPKLYLEHGKERFDWLKKVGLIEGDVEWKMVGA